MKGLFFILFFSLSLGDEENIGRWRGAIQQVALGWSRSGFGKEFTMETISKRNVTAAIIQQSSRWRGNVARAMEQSIGPSISLCPPLDISDLSVQIVKQELTEAGFHVEWMNVANVHDPHDLVDFYQAYGTFRCPICNGGRKPFRVKTPIDEKEK